MPLTPLDIHNKVFRNRWGGYVQEEVDDFLDEVVRDYETVIKERNGLKEQLENLAERVSRYEGMEQALQQALVAAQSNAEEVRANARKEAELIIQQAQMEASRIEEEGKRKLEELERRYLELQREMQVFRARVKALLEAQVEMLSTGTTTAVAVES